MINLSREEKQELQEHLKAVAKILHRHTSPEKLKRFEDIEMTLREHIQEEVSPEIASFFFRSESN